MNNLHLETVTPEVKGPRNVPEQPLYVAEGQSWLSRPARDATACELSPCFPAPTPGWEIWVTVNLVHRNRNLGEGYGGSGYGGGGREILYTYRYTVTTRMTSALK